MGFGGLVSGLVVLGFCEVGWGSGGVGRGNGSLVSGFRFFLTAVAGFDFWLRGLAVNLP